MIRSVPFKTVATLEYGVYDGKKRKKKGLHASAAILGGDSLRS